MKKWVWPTFIFLLVVPRLVRFFAPTVQIEDPNYIYGAFLIFKGLIPFHEFAQPNPPLLEAVITVLYHVFGVSYRIPEILSVLAFWGTSCLILFLGKRWFSTGAGIVASLLYSFHYLLFRYHLFERETFATLAVMAGLAILSREEYSWKSHVLAGVITGLGFAFKQTALIPFAAIAVVVLFIQFRWKRAVLFGLGFAGFVAVITLAYSLLFGEVYLRQTFYFHFIKGVVAPWQIKAQWTATGLGYLIPAAVAALPLIWRRRTHPGWILLAMVSADLVFFWFVSGAFWPHYLLSTLPSLALLAGLAIWEWGRLLARQGRRWVRIESLIMAGAVTLGIIVWNPGVLIGAGAVEQYGFQGTPRQEIEACGEFIKTRTTPDDVIISDPFIALVSERIKVVRFKDNWGLVLWMNTMMDQGKYRENVEKLSGQSFGHIRKLSQEYWMPLIETAFYQGNLGAIQPNYELPLPPDYMMNYGFGKGFESEHYTIWIKDQPLP